MANWQWSSDFFQPQAIIATSAAGGYPVARVATLDNHPLIRTWRSMTTGAQDIVIDMGAAVAVVGFAVLNVNFLTMQLLSSIDNLLYVPLFGSPYSLTNDIDGFYKFFIASGGTFRYFIVRIPAQTPITSVGYFEVGQVVLVRTLNTFPTNPEPDLVETVQRPYLHSLRTERAPVGDNYVTKEFQMTVPIVQNAQGRTLAFLGQHTPILIYKNAGITHEVGLYRADAPIVGRTASTTFRINPTFSEMV